MTGTVSVLNAGYGDVSLRFNPHDPGETDKTRKVVEKMIAEGYAIVVKDGDRYSRVEEFDPDTDEYVIAAVPGAEDTAPEWPLKMDPATYLKVHPDGPNAEAAREIVKGERTKKKRVKARQSEATAIAPSAGG